MQKNEDGSYKAWQFAVTGFPMPPFITRRRKQRAREFAEALREIQGMIGVEPIGRKALVLFMESENDVIIAKNRLMYSGFPVSEEVYEDKIWKVSDGETKKGE